jgi:hypothetical protein
MINPFKKKMTEAETEAFQEAYEHERVVQITKQKEQRRKDAALAGWKAAQPRPIPTPQNIQKRMEVIRKGIEDFKKEMELIGKSLESVTPLADFSIYPPGKKTKSRRSQLPLISI